ncbi:MAG: pantoate--beta-alanine ligase [Elusimicrobia bacterium RIFCSPLOWO2_01_FULL_59_12]|nr:MAG: pantoate--beta-alanine ligase [Elusimicrobia bacterium RIFCSPLOWO2_01_FULL_59_12]
MKIIHSVEEMKSSTHATRRGRRSIGFVPTMGALHEGHRALIRRARRENDQVVVSIFVNPAQFGPREDFTQYPRALSKDLALLKQEKCDVVFIPSASQIYPPEFSTWVDVPACSASLCGKFRPGHFRGVATVVAALFQIVQPTRAYFGLKDYQQCRVIDRMVKDLQIPVRVVACPTVREPDGLACSSRNRRLSKRDREEAVKLYQALYLGRELIEQKIMLDSGRLETRLKQVLSQIPHCRIDYIAVVDPVTLAPMRKIRRPAVLAAALWIGKTRLIDNVVIS